jgi:hypothetical protein
MHCLLWVSMLFLTAAPQMSTLFLLKPTDILKESMYETSSPYSRLLQTSYFTGLLCLRLTASDLQPIFSEVIHISDLQLTLLCVLKRNIIMTCNFHATHDATHMQLAIVHMQLTCNLLSSIYNYFTSTCNFVQGLTSMTTNLLYISFNLKHQIYHE